MIGVSAPFRDMIEDERLRTLADAWWRGRVDEGVPSWRDVSRSPLKPLLPAVVLCRYSPGEQSFQLETLSDDMRGLTRLPIDGKRIERLLPPDMLPEVRGNLLGVIAGPAIEIIKVRDLAKPERGAVEERLLMPLRSGGRGAPDLVLVAYARLDPRAAGWLPITQESLAVTRLPVAE